MARDFSSGQGLENDGILCVFLVLQTAVLAEKIRRPLSRISSEIPGNAMQIAPGDGELSMLSVLAAGYHGGRALARRYYEAAKKYLDSSQIAQIHAQLGH